MFILYCFPVVNPYDTSLSRILEMFVCGFVFFHCNLLMAHDVFLSCYSCSLWLKALIIVPSRCLYCNSFLFVLCFCFCFLLGSYTTENGKQCKSGWYVFPQRFGSTTIPAHQSFKQHGLIQSCLIQEAIICHYYYLFWCLVCPRFGCPSDLSCPSHYFLSIHYFLVQWHVPGLSRSFLVSVPSGVFFFFIFF